MSRSRWLGPAPAGEEFFVSLGVTRGAEGIPGTKTARLFPEWEEPLREAETERP